MTEKRRPRFGPVFRTVWGIGFRGRIMEKYLFWGAFFFAYLINGITGFAGNVFAMPVGIQTIGHDTSIVVLNCTGLLASSLIAFTGIKHVVWREVAKMSVIMLIFMAVGAWLNTVVPLPILTKIYGVAVLVMAFRGLLAGGEDKLLPEWALLLILSIAGLIQGCSFRADRFWPSTRCRSFAIRMPSGRRRP